MLLCFQRVYQQNGAAVVEKPICLWTWVNAHSTYAQKLLIKSFLFASRTKFAWTYRDSIDHHCLCINHARNRFAQCNIIPKINSISRLDSAVSNCTYAHCGLVGKKDDSVLLDKPFVTSKQDCIQHALINQKVTHALRDQDINRLSGGFNFFHFKCALASLHECPRHLSKESWGNPEGILTESLRESVHFKNRNLRT